LKFNPDDINLEEEAPKADKGKLFVVSTPIGNKEDISLRAIRILKLADLVLCEEFKVGAALLHQHSITKDLDNLNEQNELEKVIEIINLMKSGKRVALISDCGTPVFADPGASLVKAALKANIDIEVVPGASSIMTALVRSGLDISSFLYAGFLSRKTEDRIVELEQLSKEKRTVVVLETPYRFSTFLAAAAEAMPNRTAYIGMNLTLPSESNHYGTFLQLREKFGMQKIKTEFVVCFSGSYGDEKKINRALFEDQREEKKDFKNRRPEVKQDKFGNPIEEGAFARSYKDGKPSFFRKEDFLAEKRKSKEEYYSNRPEKNWDDRPAFNRDDRDSRPERRPWSAEKPDFKRDDRGGERRDFKSDRPAFNRDDRDSRPERRPWSAEKPDFKRDDRGGERRDFKSDRPAFNRDDKDSRPERRPWSAEKPDFKRDDRGGERRDFKSDRPAFNRDDKDSRPERRPWSADKPDFKRDDRGGERRNDGFEPRRRSDSDRPSGVRRSGGDSNRKDGRSGGRKNSR